MTDHDAGPLSCPICGSSVSFAKTALTTSGDSRPMGMFHVYICSACSNGFTYPSVPAELYRLPPDISRHRLPRGVQWILNAFMQRRVSRMRSDGFQQQGSKLLDIGGGSCAFANCAAHDGYDVTVIEPNEKNAVFADTRNKVKFVARHFSPALLDQGLLQEGVFDMVTMWHSLEHFARPAEALQLVHRLLKPGGSVLISVPNIHSCQARFGGNYWAYLDVPHHLTHFTPPGLAGALANAGFAPVRSFPVSLEYDLFGWYQTWLNVLSRSYNYYYNRTKKNRLDEDYVTYPGWTKFITTMGAGLLPLVLCCTLVALFVKSPSCVEVLYRRPQ